MNISPDWVQAAAAVLTLGAALAALRIAGQAPRLAAKFADDYRRESAAEDERQRMRMLVFTALVKGRRQMQSDDTIAALNLIDVVFADCPHVRDSWREFMAAATEQPFDASKIVERYHNILSAVTRELGFADQISASDLRLGYYPEGRGKMDAAALAEAEDKLARLALSQNRLERR